MAVHFATFEEQHYDKDGAIWCIDVAEARALLPEALREVLRREDAFLFSVEMLDFLQSLNDFDRLGERNPFVLFFEPPSLDARIVNQGEFILMFDEPPTAACIVRAAGGALIY